MFSQIHNNIVTIILQFPVKYCYQKGVFYVFYSSGDADRFG